MKKMFIVFLIFITIFSINIVSAENFTDLQHQITEKDFVSLNEDIILNQNTFNEENTFMDGISIKNKQISIEGNNHTIFAKDSNFNQAKLFNIINSNVTLSNMLISSANFNGAGGAISLDLNSTLILKNVTFKNNSALGIHGEGGAVYSAGTLFCYDCTFENNYANGGGGAIYALAQNSTISSSKFINNTAKWYGGAILSCANVSLDSSIFDSNKAYSGSAFHYSVSSRSLDYTNKGQAIFSNSIFRNNQAKFGGAISSASLRMIGVLNSCFVNNTALKGGVLYKSGMTMSYFDDCLFENNSAEIGALFFDDSYDDSFDSYFSCVELNDCCLKNNFASDRVSVFYGRSANFWANNTKFYNTGNYEIYNGIGNITVLNSLISNYSNEFITQFIRGNIIFVNNTLTGSTSNFKDILNFTSNSNIIFEGNYDKPNITRESYNDVQNTSILSSECASVYVRINSTDFTISQRRDGSDVNFTVYVDKTEDYIREFKGISEYFLLSKVFTNGWVIGDGGWDESATNEAIEAIAAEMVYNEHIDEESLKFILDLKKIAGAGHFLIVAPNGTYGCVVTYKGSDIFEMGVLADGDYIVCPNGVDYWRHGHLDNIDDVVKENVYLASSDLYGFNRHCILVHHVKLNENGFSDDVYVSNEGGSLVNQTNYIYADSFWLGDKYTDHSEIPLSPDYKYLGTYYALNKTIVSKDDILEYGSDYIYTAQFVNRDGDVLANKIVQVIVNGKSYEYVTDNDGFINIHFYNLISNQTIIVTNPITGDVVKNTITVLPNSVPSTDSNESEDVRLVIVVGKNQVSTFKFDKQSSPVKNNSVNISVSAIQISSTLWEFIIELLKFLLNFPLLAGIWILSPLINILKYLMMLILLFNPLVW